MIRLPSMRRLPAHRRFPAAALALALTLLPGRGAPAAGLAEPPPAPHSNRFT